MLFALKVLSTMSVLFWAAIFTLNRLGFKEISINYYEIKGWKFVFLFTVVFMILNLTVTIVGWAMYLLWVLLP